MLWKCFEQDNFSIDRKLRKSKKFSDPKGDKTIKVFPQGTYIAQTFIPKTSTIPYSVTKGIFKIYQLERELWLSEVLRIHQSSVIHSLMSENDKTFVTFTRNEVRGTYLVFSKEEISRFHI